MNNLKRVLSLGLSGAMLAGMVTIGASAANTDFGDAADIEHTDAVNTLVSLNVINGKDDGNFDPEGYVTRAEMAKMIAVAMNGGKDTATGTKGTPSFTDIGGHWAESYIEYCYDLGIINGRGDGTFDPEGNVTGLEATKMVLTALGYDSEAYKLTGAIWATRTDELAKAASPSLYDELDNTVMSRPATRDVAAQLIWNGLQNDTMSVTPSTNTSNGEVTWQYGTTKHTLLKERYDADILTGTYVGNHDTLQAGEEGDIRVTGLINDTTSCTATFPSDLDISNIGEEVKVIYKEGKGGTTGPDKKDTIYGVFNTGKTVVYNVTMNDIQSAGTDNLAKGKIKFGGTLYDVAAAGVDIEYNYNSSSSSNLYSQSASDVQTALKNTSVDTIKFVCDSDGKIDTAYVVNYNLSKVSGVSASKVTINGVGTIDIADNDVYADVAKDDVVVYTRFYSDTDKDDAYFTVTKAETVEGTLTGFKYDSSTYQNVVVDGTTYKVQYTVGSFPSSLTDDSVANLNDLASRGGAAIGDSVKLYLVGTMVGAVDLVSATGGNYAIITETNNSSTVKVGSDMNPLKVTVMLSDGSKQTLVVHKDSTIDGSVKLSTKSESQINTLIPANVGTLIEYSSISNGYIKIKTIATTSSTAISTASKLWDENTKKLAYYDDNATSEKTAVAASDAVLFVGVDADAFTNVDDYYVYNLRSLGDIAKESTNTKVGYILDSNGLVKAAYVTRNGRPTGSTDDTLYGMITAYVGSRQNSDGDDLYQYTVTVGRDEDVTISVPVSTYKAGDLIRFKERNDGEYSSTEVVKLLSSDDTVNSSLGDSTTVALAAIRDYNTNTGLVTYYSNTGRSSATVAYTGTAASATTTSDVEIVYVNASDKKAGEAVGVTAFDSSTGYANAMLHFNTKGVVDAIIVETSGKGNLAKAQSANNATTSFGTTTVTVDVKSSDKSIAVAAGEHGAYTVAMSSSSAVAVGAEITVNVTLSGTIDSANSKETVKVTYNGVTKTVDFTTAGTQSVKFTAAADVTEVTATVEATAKG